MRDLQSIISDIVNFNAHRNRVKKLILAYKQSTSIEEFYANAPDFNDLPSRAKGAIYIKIYLGGPNKYRNQELHIRQLINELYYIESAREYKERIELRIKSAKDEKEIMEFLQNEEKMIKKEQLDAMLLPFYADFDSQKQTEIENIESKFYSSCGEIVNQQIEKYDLFTIQNSQDHLLPDSFEFDIEDQERFVYCQKLGIIDHLKNLIISKGGKGQSKDIIPLMGLITGINHNTVKRLFTFYNNQNNGDRRNPFRNDKLMKMVVRNLTNRGLE